MTCLDEALESARQSNGIELEDVEQVLLVGGSTRIACVRPMLAERLGLDLRDVRIDIDPDEVVARGAGMLAREFAPSEAYEEDEIRIDAATAAAPAEDAIVLQDVTSHSLGVRTLNDRFSIILHKDSRIPAEATQRYTNAGPYTDLAVQVFQGENVSAIDNEFVGSVPITFPEPRERGYWNLEVTFGLDTNGLLHATVHCVNNGNMWEADLRCSVHAGNLSENAAKLHDAMAGMPKPPAKDSEPAVDVLPPPPDGTPADYRMVARRSYKDIPQLDAEPQAELRAAYTAFVGAVTAGSDDVEDLGDTLFDVYTRVKRP
jgi:molecular chaperone DnaK